MKYRQIIPADARQVPPLTPGWHEHGPLSLDELAEWCGGQVFGRLSGRPYIVVPTLDNRAWPGDWILPVGPREFRTLSHAEFASNFAPVEEES